jgi:hypothetical protein
MFCCSRRFKTARYKNLSSNKWEARQVLLDHPEPTYFLPLVTLLHAFPKLNTDLIPLVLDLYLGRFS